MAPVLFSLVIPASPGKSGLGINLKSLRIRDKFDILLGKKAQYKILWYVDIVKKPGNE